METETNNTGVYENHSMKWFKFIIYVQLFLATVSGVVSAWQMFSGSIYDQIGSSAESIYQYYGGGLRAADMIMGVLYLGFAVMALYVRGQLAAFRQKAPTFYIAWMITNYSLTLVYQIAVGLICNVKMFGTFDMFYVVMQAIFVYCNYIYFSKRRELFCN